MKFIEYPDRDLMVLRVADILAGQLADFLRRNERASFSVPGGTTPGPVFDVLAGIDLDWSRVTLILNDERWVPAESARSNTRLVRRHLLQGKAAAASLLPLITDDPEPEDALPALTAALQPHLPLSLLLVGMGEDMHTASLFPGAEGLESALSSKAPPLAVLRGADLPEPRISLTAPVLRGAMASHVLIKGATKRAAIERALQLPEIDAPIRVILDGATVHWAE